MRSFARTMVAGFALAAMAVAVPQFAVAGNAYGKGGAKKDIVQTAQSAKIFTTLITALKEADLAQTLKGAGPFTVFAPTDEAFAKLPAGTLEGLLKDKAKLKAVLLYHVASGKVTAAQVGGLTSVETLNGQSLSVNTASGVKIGGATVVKADVLADNGVIHVIDTVLVPSF